MIFLARCDNTVYVAEASSVEIAFAMLFRRLAHAPEKQAALTYGHTKVVPYAKQLVSTPETREALYE